MKGCDHGFLVDKTFLDGYNTIQVFKKNFFSKHIHVKGCKDDSAKNHKISRKQGRPEHPYRFKLGGGGGA